MNKSGRPLVPTVKNKKHETVLFDVAAHMEMAGQFDVGDGIRRGLAQARKGIGRSADEVFDELERG